MLGVTGVSRAVLGGNIMKNLVFLAAAIAVAGASPALAGDPAIDLTSPGDEYPGGQYTLGFEFSVDGGGSIDALGVYDSGQDGLTAPASIGIWDMQGNLLTSATINAGDGTLEGYFRWVSISPFALTAGTHYVIGAYTTDNASSVGTDQGGSANFNPAVTFYDDRFSNFNSAFSFPDTSEGFPNAGWLGANFELAGGVPEPASWAMMVGGFGLMGAVMRRRRTAIRFA